MKKKHESKARGLAIVLFSAVLMLALAACAVSQPSSSTSSASVPYGKPWASSIFAGNLPSAQPAAKDDLYTHSGYDYLKSHQDGSTSTLMGDAGNELKTSVSATIDDTGVTTPELEQLRIFYRQAADADALETAGAGELRPYLKAIADTRNIDELRALLASPDFPFSPWVDTAVTAPDMMSEMCVAVIPRMLFSDAEDNPEIYLDSDDPGISSARSQLRRAKTVKAQGGLSMLSICDDDQVAKRAEELFALEKTYGKDTFQDKSAPSGYGTQSEAVKSFTLDELAAACPNFPIRDVLAKYGQDKGAAVVVMYPGWLTSFNSIWTEDNFEDLRALTELKVLAECSDFLSPTLFAGTYSQLGEQPPSAKDAAWAACDRTDTFSQLLAKTYVDYTLGQQAQDDLIGLSNELIDTYIGLIGKTTWLNADSREKVNDKIDNMALNILSPDGGYFDYSGLRLVPSEEGGTLLSNYLRLKAYNEQCEADLVGKPARASAVWYSMRPTARNCFYDPISNSINIFPGFVTSAVYDKAMAPEELLGSMGFTVAHEISHAFDYANSQFDAYGRPDPVFTADDISELAARRDKLAARYSAIEVSPGKSIDGAGVSAEAMADLSGMQAIAERGKVIDGFDFSKMFRRVAETWAAVYPEAYADVLLRDAHAPANARINVSSQMTDAFYGAFDVSEGNGMYLAPEERIALWGESAK